jgi:uncharacterized protein YukE
VAGSLFVAPTQLRASAAAVAEARQALHDARAVLELAGGRLEHGLDGDHAHRFVRQWRSELELVRGMLDGCTDVVEQAAGSYEELDAGLAGR